jgi:hypothetical protein
LHGILHATDELELEGNARCALRAIPRHYFTLELLERLLPIAAFMDFAPNLRNSACMVLSQVRTVTFGTSSTQQHWLRAMSATLAKQHLAGFARCCLELARSAKTATHRARFTQMAHEYLCGFAKSFRLT